MDLLAHVIDPTMLAQPYMQNALLTGTIVALPAGGHVVGASAPVPDLRPRRLLRQLAGPPRHTPRPSEDPPGHRVLRARRALGVVLRRSGRGGRAGGGRAVLAVARQHGRPSKGGCRMAEHDLHAVAFPKLTEAQLAALGRCSLTRLRRFHAGEKLSLGGPLFMLAVRLIPYLLL